MKTYELVIPARFADYLDGIHLFQTRDAQGDEDGIALLAAWDESTTRRGQVVLTIDFTNGNGRGILNYLKEYAETVSCSDMTDYTRGERTAADKVLERISEINRQFRADSSAKKTVRVHTLHFSPRTDKITEDGEELQQVPYPFHANPEGHIGAQDIWQGDPAKVIGFVRKLGEQRVDLRWKEFLNDPQQAVGMYVITADREGNWSTHVGAISEVTTSEKS